MFICISGSPVLTRLWWFSPTSSPTASSVCTPCVWTRSSSVSVSSNSSAHSCLPRITSVCLINSDQICCIEEMPRYMKKCKSFHYLAAEPKTFLTFQVSHIASWCFWGLSLILNCMNMSCHTWIFASAFSKITACVILHGLIILKIAAAWCCKLSKNLKCLWVLLLACYLTFFLFLSPCFSLTSHNSPPPLPLFTGSITPFFNF